MSATLVGRPTQIALNRRLAFMASQRHRWLIRAHSKHGATTNFDSAALSATTTRARRVFFTLGADVSPYEGESRWLPDPGLKPWAKICNRLAVKPYRYLGLANSA